MTAAELAAYWGSTWGELDRAAQWRLRLADHGVTAVLAIMRCERCGYEIAINRMTAMLEVGGAERGKAS